MNVSAPVHAQDLGPNAQLQFFATCAGRLAAVVEREWNEDGTISALAAHQRDQVGDIIAAIATRDRSRDVLIWRNDGKAAQTALIARARSAGDAEDAAWAARRAQELRRECVSVLLG
ncbi:hypothetical protein [Yoonia sp. 2307UL14-13]|uniref:hypothetical protein n=1 Tax=Yoonia sp. 2307UL14-13 TaxID=3126506 RepID=UPI0030B06D13